MDAGETLIAPFRFAIVEEGVHRGAYPSLKNYRFLYRLRLRTLISCTPEPPISDLHDYCKHEGIEQHHFQVDKWDESMTFQPKMMAQILQILTDATKLPVYIHCLDGANITGLVIMCLRKLQHFSPSFYLAEFRRFECERRVSSEETQFVEDFCEPLALPDEIPFWLWGGEHVTSHPTMRLASEMDEPNDALSGDKHAAMAAEPELRKGSHEIQWLCDHAPIDLGSITHGIFRSDSLLAPFTGPNLYQRGPGIEEEPPKAFQTNSLLSALCLEGCTMEPLMPHYTALQG